MADEKQCPDCKIALTIAKERILDLVDEDGVVYETKYATLWYCDQCKKKWIDPEKREEWLRKDRQDF